MPVGRSWSSEGWAAIAGAIGSTLLLARKLLSPKSGKPELMSRADFYAELADLKDHIHGGQLALVEKLDANHRELLAAPGAAGQSHQLAGNRPRPRGRAHPHLSSAGVLACEFRRRLAAWSPMIFTGRDAR
jgi:hypothetical protein